MAKKPPAPRRAGGAAPKTSAIRSTDSSRIEDRRSSTDRSLSREWQSQNPTRVTKSVNPPHPSQEVMTGGIMPPKRPVRNPGLPVPRKQAPRPPAVNPSTGTNQSYRKQAPSYRMNSTARGTPGPPKQTGTSGRRKK